MILWISAAALALLVLAAILYPLVRGPGRMGRGADYDLAVYRDQLEELERNRALGWIGESEAEAARAEIGRRMLAADRRRERKGGEGGSGRWSVYAAAGVMVAAIGGAGITYVQVGAPDKPAMPFAERQGIPKDRSEIIAARTGNQRGQAQARQQQQAGGSDGSGQSGGMPDIATAEKQLAERLADQPDDVEGWLLLGRTRLQQRDYEGAREAFGKAHALRPDNTRIATGYAEAIVMANEGTVTPKAEQIFRDALRQVPDNPQVNYYVALADFQAGKTRQALDRWKRMVAASPADAPWLSVVRRHMAAAEAQLGIEQGSTYAAVAPDPNDGGGASGGGPSGNGQGTSGQGAGGAMQTAQSGTSGGGSGTSGGDQAGPTREQMQAARDMSPEARREMIQGMVDRLAARLEENPSDAQGWMRLARSYRVLDKPEAAMKALKRASEVAPENVDVLARYARALREAAGQRQTDKSVELSRRILEIDGDHAEALWFVGLHAAREGDTDRARELLDKAIANLPDTPQTQELRRRADQIVGDG